MSQQVREANIHDIQIVFKMMTAFTAEQNLSSELIIDQQSMLDSFDQYKCWVVLVDSQIEGYLLAYTRYSTWKGIIIHLEDIYVNPHKRKSGLAHLMFQQLIKYTNQMGYQRIQLDIQHSNSTSIQFFQKRQCNIMTDWNLVKMHKQAIDNHFNSIHQQQQQIKIRKANEDDMQGIFELIQELAVYEECPNEVVVDTEYMKQQFNMKAFQCYVAILDNKIQGIALCFKRFSSKKGMTLHLEDFYVRENMRKHGIGSLLFNEVVKQGYEMGVPLISWDVLDWNQLAIDFYVKRNADIQKEWDIGQFDIKAIQNNLGQIS